MKVDRLSFHSGDHKEKTNTPLQIKESDQKATERERKLVDSFCSFQSRVGPPEYRRWRRVHGLQLPLHPQQVTGWIIFLAVAAATFFVLIPALRPFFRQSLFVVLGTLFSLHLLSHLTALLLDPADPELRALKVKFSVPEFDRTKHAHVIENGRCHLCNIKTSSPRTKHCSVCNKCIDHFDHHCKWLNHCIGGRNYVAFLICVISAVAASLVVVGVSVLEIVYYHIDPESLTVFPSHQNETASELFLPDSVFLGIVTVLGLLAATTAGLLLHLCLFHCYISVLGITTYEYIRNYRRDATESTQRIASIGRNCRKAGVLSNHLEISRGTGTRNCSPLKNCSFSASPPPPDDEDERVKCRSSVTSFSYFTPFNYLLTRKKEYQKRPLERQNTDPQFVDRVIKPFIINLNDEKNSQSATNDILPADTHYVSENETEYVRCDYLNRCNCTRGEEAAEHPKRGKTRKIFYCKNLRLCWPEKSTAGTDSPENVHNSVKTKINQVRPTTTEQPSRPSNEKIVQIKDKCPEGLDPDSFITMKTKVLPELSESLKKIRSASDLKKIGQVLDLIDRPEPDLTFRIHTKSSCRKSRKKIVLKKSRSPSLSPIQESGLSNPNSPRVDLIMPATPLFKRPPTPETSLIFLSNPNSSSSSSDDDEVVLPSAVSINMHYNSEDILQTPRLPRKIYSVNKENIFVRTPSGSRSAKPIQMQFKNHVSAKLISND